MADTFFWTATRRTLSGLPAEIVLYDMHAAMAVAERAVRARLRVDREIVTDGFTDQFNVMVHRGGERWDVVAIYMADQR